ncbi:FUSC family protein [Pseudomonas yamanorum]|uniref:FUSC family protein n=1 Tax=Pseudomonas yamanorum TaxID=515393 RepID=UPI0015A3C6BE|nr:FUSC family protein [Pseudomonas yamanorum]NWD24171.1 FUSC family protein [Pseudomonas yamanorum]
MSRPILLARWLVALPWRRGMLDWARTDGLMWLYLGKVLIASYLTLWLSMRLELPQPSTAMTTVFIVMQPHSGHVLAKSIYRFIGTLVGSSFMVLLMAVFAQSTELFLAGLALWVGVCSTGAARNRNFRAYGFVLAGYTAVMVGLPVVGHPEQVFMAAIWRVLEITLGILCASLISATVFPNTASAAMRNTLYQRFGRFAGFVLSGLRNTTDQAAFESANLRFIAEAVGLEVMRSVTVFEDPDMRRRNGRLNRLNSEFMAITTRFNALHQLLERVHLRGGAAVVQAIDPGLSDLVEVLKPFAGHALTDRDAVQLSANLHLYKGGLPAHVRRLRAALEQTMPGADDLLDFHTAYELLYRFVDELHSYAQTHASLADHNHVREQWDESFQPQTNWLAAIAAGLRSAVVLLVLSTLWIGTSWPSGAAMTLVSALTVGLSAFSVNPKRMSFQIACGTVLAAVTGIFEVFFVYPLIDGFALLCMVMAPVIVVGSFWLARPQWVGYGLGMLVFFGTSSVPGNLTIYNPYGLINDYIAMIFGMLVCAAAGAIILPPNSPWLWRRLEQDLRRQVVFAISAPLQALGSGFESGTRDLLNQAYNFSAGKPLVQHRLLRWMFVVLDVGHAIIELRREQAQLPDDPRYAESMPWRQAIRAMGRALIRLFVKPGPQHLQRALASVEHAIECVHQTREPFAAHFETSALRRVESYLHFIRTSLLDPQSPLALHAPSGVSHAS